MKKRVRIVGFSESKLKYDCADQLPTPICLQNFSQNIDESTFKKDLYNNKNPRTAGFISSLSIPI